MTTNAETLSDFVVGLSARRLPDEVLDAARKCLADWLGVAIAGHDEGAARTVRAVVTGWAGRGRARILLGPTTNPAAAALVNGTMAHCLDFDDTHVGSLAHLSGPTWAAVLAFGTHKGSTPEQMLRAFVAGFEVGARLGGGGLGEALNARSLHSTGTFGCLAAAAAAAVMLDLDRDGVVRALGAAATQAAGLTASFGTMAKPFHAGKAAFNGALGAELAAAGFEPSRTLLETSGGLAAALVQDGAVAMQPLGFDGWELLRNTFKPYASCLLTHPVIDAAREVATRLDGGRVTAIRVGVHPMAVQLAGNPRPRTPLEAKFSTAYCAALGLAGRAAAQTDFSDERLGDERLRDLTARVRLEPSPEIAKTAAWLEAEVPEGRRIRAAIPMALGNPERPMGWSDIQAKFSGLVAPVVGTSAAEHLFDAVRRFRSTDDVTTIDGLRSPSRPAARIA